MAGSRGRMCKGGGVVRQMQRWHNHIAKSARRRRRRWPHERWRLLAFCLGGQPSSCLFEWREIASWLAPRITPLWRAPCSHGAITHHTKREQCPSTSRRASRSWNARRLRRTRCCMSWTRHGLTRRKGPKLEALTSSPATSSTEIARIGSRAPRGIFSQSTSRRLPPYDRFAHFHESHGKALSGLLDEFEQLGAEKLATLAAWRLTDTELALDGGIPSSAPSRSGSCWRLGLCATWDISHRSPV